jgi:hypothetical protein
MKIKAQPLGLTGIELGIAEDVSERRSFASQGLAAFAAFGLLFITVHRVVKIISVVDVLFGL